MDIEKTKAEIKSMSEAITKIELRAKSQGRGLNGDELALVAEMEGIQAALKKELPVGPPVTLQNGPLGGMYGRVESGSGPYALRGPNDPKDYRSLFGDKGGMEWADRDTNFFSAVFSGRHHPGLIRGALNETTPSEGGFWVPVQQAANIHAISLENEIVQPRCYVQPMASNTLKIPAMVIGDHSTSLFGGFTASYTSEAGTISEHSPKARGMELNARKLTGLIRFSSELSADTPGGMGQIETICGKGLGFYRDKAFLKGTGAGEPLGILNADCLVTVAKQVGQKKLTVVYENLLDMMARMFAGSFANSTWVAHQSCIPQLLSLSLSVGVGGAPVPVMSQQNGVFTILTRPVLFTEKVPSLGTKGDIGLFDFSQYVVGLRNGMRFDTSIHVAFETDELLSRIIERHDGQPLWDKALTLADGTTTVSPFVVIADRLV